jgi:hypothetical protein
VARYGPGKWLNLSQFERHLPRLAVTADDGWSLNARTEAPALEAN